MGCLNKQEGSAGFSLVEVSLAILVVGLGLLTVFSLFPSGLRSAEDEVADTRAGLLAETIFGGMRGNVDAITNWSDWSDFSLFKAAIKTPIQGIDTLNVDGTVEAISFPQGTGPILRYQLTLLDDNAPDTYKAVLQVCDSEKGPFNVQSTFYTEFYFKGL